MRWTCSYALSLGLLNGDLFTHVIAFSPGFMTKGSRRGRSATPSPTGRHAVPTEVVRAALDWLAGRG